MLQAKSPENSLWRINYKKERSNLGEVAAIVKDTQSAKAWHCRANKTEPSPQKHPKQSISMHPLFWRSHWVVAQLTTRFDNMEGRRQIMSPRLAESAMLQYIRKGVYGHLEKRRRFQQQKLRSNRTQSTNALLKKILRVTEYKLGKQFASVCVLRKQRTQQRKSAQPLAFSFSL